MHYQLSFYGNWTTTQSPMAREGHQPPATSKAENYDCGRGMPLRSPSNAISGVQDTIYT